MIEIHCDICGAIRKFRSGIAGDYRLWFTTILIEQICEKDKELPTHAIDICKDCRDKLLDGGEPNRVYARFDDGLVAKLKEILNH